MRFEDELGFGMDEHAEALLRTSAALVTQPAGERTLAELQRLSPAGYRRLDLTAPRWYLAPGGAFVMRGATVIAWHLRAPSPPR